MNIVAVIPARGGSKGIPGKNTKILLGRPMVAWTIRHALHSIHLDRIIVSTDSKKIASISRKYGAEVIIRPGKLAQDNSPIEEALRHVVSTLRKKENYKTDIIVELLANTPVREKGIIDKTIKRLIETKASAVMTVCKVSQHPEWMKKLEGDKLIPYIKCNLKVRQDLEKLYICDGSVVAIKEEALMRTRRRIRVHSFLGNDLRGIIQDPLSSLEIDKPSDLKLAEWILSHK